MKSLRAPLAITAMLLMLWVVLLCTRPPRSRAESFDIDRRDRASVADFAKPSPFEIRKKTGPARHYMAQPATDAGGSSQRPDAVDFTGPQTLPVEWNASGATPVRFDADPPPTPQAIR
jgi:hypothetical protein